MTSDTCAAIVAFPASSSGFNGSRYAQPPRSGGLTAANPAPGGFGSKIETVGGRSAIANDPLAGMSDWQLFQRSIWVSDEDAHTKVSLLCISRYMDKELHASSMSYAQIARDCGFSEATAKRCAKRVANVWLKIGVGKGRYVPGKGNENLYHGIIPRQWADEVRRRMLRGIAIEPDETVLRAADAALSDRSGVSGGHPEQSGVSVGYPDNAVSGCQADTGVSHSTERGVTETHLLQTPPEEDKERRGATAPTDLSQPGGAQIANGEDAPRVRRHAELRQAAKVAFDLYLETARRYGLAMPESVDPWLPNITARLRRSGMDGWKRMLGAVENSAFLCGENERGFAADLDWLVKPKNFEKVLSGKYARRNASHGGVF